uniref:Uncharacterized protein n=1 Tax=Opuntia streptacantha TaxID=393608 RepID=A0A7C8ZSK5_OPUST
MQLTPTTIAQITAYFITRLITRISPTSISATISLLLCSCHSPKREANPDLPPSLSSLFCFLALFFSVLFLRRHCVPANRARPVHSQPLLNASAMEPVFAGHLLHNHGTIPLLQANRAISVIVLPDFDTWHRLDRRFRRRRRAFLLRRGAKQSIQI